jgi:hypothetical protein
MVGRFATIPVFPANSIALENRGAPWTIYRHARRGLSRSQMSALRNSPSRMHDIVSAIDVDRIGWKISSSQIQHWFSAWMLVCDFAMRKY